MQRTATQLRQPAPEFRSSRLFASDTPVMELVVDTSGKADPQVKSFFKQFKDELRAELGDELFELVGVSLDKQNDTVSFTVDSTMDGLREAVLIVINRVMKGFHCLRFDPREMMVSLA